MPSIRYERGTVTSLATTELNSLANNAGVFCTAEFDNAASNALWLWGDFELIVSFGTAPGANVPVELYVIPAANGTDYASADTSAPPPNLFAGAWLVRNTTATQRLVIRQAALPPSRFRILVRNTTGQAFAASGNEIHLLPYRTQV